MWRVRVTVAGVTTAQDAYRFDRLVREYVASLPFSLDFQAVDDELADLSGVYGPPSGSALLADLDGSPVGCVGIRLLEPGVAELKRMYVRPWARGRGVGQALAKAALATAEVIGYEVLRLDTTGEMVGAIRIYERLGFVPIAAYRHNPLDGAQFYQVHLGATAGDPRQPPHSPRSERETPDR